MPPARAVGVPWYVRLMLGAAGWLAALFLLGFIAVGLAWVMKSELASVLVGLIMMAMAWLMLRRLGRNDFATQFALALSFAGQVLFAVGIFGWLGMERDATAAWTVMSLAQAILALVMPNVIHRLWSAFATAVAFGMLLHSLGLSFLSPSIILVISTWAWLNEFAWPEFGPAWRPMAYGLLLALVAMDMAAGAFQPLTGIGIGFESSGPIAPWVEKLLPGFILLWLVWTLLRRWQVDIPGRMANVVLLDTLILILASLKAPGISVGICIILLGYAHGNRVLTGLGVAALLLYLSAYYYSLDDTLLVKSQALALSGAVLLTLRWLSLRWILRDTGPADE